MTVFDNTGFSTRSKRDKLNITKLKEWKEGFDDGYKAALDRYIDLNK